ncbi:hypothetical protein BH09BAC5_BH09BAC5_06620 [soil metagenome]
MPFLHLKNNLFFLVIVLITISFNAHSQKTNCDYYISPNYHYGQILAHHDYIKTLVDGNIQAFELDVAKPTCGIKNWQSIYHCPEIGLTFVVVRFPNPQLLGNGFSLYPFINFNITHGERFTLKFKIATSLGYVTKKYDSITDPTNIIIGSHLNGFVNLRLNAQFRISEKLRIETGIGLTHFSNGAMKLPNLGLNIATLNLGIGFHAGPKTCIYQPNDCASPENKLHLVTCIAAGFSALAITNTEKYGAFVISANLERYAGFKSKWNSGLEFAYDAAQYERHKNDTSINFTRKYQNVQVGFKIGYALVAGRLSMPIEMGYNVYSKIYSNTTIPNHFFHRIGLRYKINEHLSGSVTLRTRWSHADFFEWGFTYAIPVGKKATCLNSY